MDIQSRLPKVHVGAFDKPVWTIACNDNYISADTWNFLSKKKTEVD